MIWSAIVAAIGIGDSFANGCGFAAWLELVPMQISTGDAQNLAKMSKRGNRYPRVVFVQAVWVALERSGPIDGRLWAPRRHDRRPRVFSKPSIRLPASATSGWRALLIAHSRQLCQRALRS
ncbi:hypothetical protein CWO90_21750 [Bradyrhizobium sp. Leo121]|nr:hypothetical protein CWO90_21750 [Bradyrhizobium sp. Leo121]